MRQKSLETYSETRDQFEDEEGSPKPKQKRGNSIVGLLHF